MPQCAVVTCGNTYRKVSNVRYHRFPPQKSLREQWKQACGRTGTEYNCETGRVCSLHFCRESYEKDLEHELLGLPPRTRLRHGTVPDIQVPGDMPNFKSKAVKRRLNVKKSDGNKIVQNGHHVKPAVKTKTLSKKTILRVDESLNINGRPIRKKKKTEKYSAYEKDGRESPEKTLKEETNLLLALGLTPIKREDSTDLNKMHVMEEESVKGKLADTAEESEKKSAEDVVSDDKQPKVDGELAAPSPPPQTASVPSPITVNGVPESGVHKSELVEIEEVDVKKELLKSTNGLEIVLVPSPDNVKIKEEKAEEEDNVTVESSQLLPEAKDLTVTCATSYDVQQSQKNIGKQNNPKVISISVEQCQQKEGTERERGKPKLIGMRKRSNKSTDSDENEKMKKMRFPDVEQMNDEREQWINLNLDKATGNSLEELQKNSEKLQQEIHSLSAMARKKEIEWNQILRLKKIKEEMFLRLLRRKQVAMFMVGGGSLDGEWDLTNDNFLNEETSMDYSLNRHPKIPSTLTIARSQGSPSQNTQRFLMQPHNSEKNNNTNNNQSLMMVPIVSSTPVLISSSGKGHNSRPSLKIPQPDKEKLKNNFKNNLVPILPKPNPEHSPPIGRQGPIVDVKSIIADYRQAHPEQIPRRGRRLKERPPPPPPHCFADNMVSSSRNVLSMSSLALGSGSQVRTIGSSSDYISYIVTNQDSSRPSSADSNRSGHQQSDNQSASSVSFKDVLVEFAKRSQNTQSDKGKGPIYPEVTLHPVLPSGSQSPPNPSTSLLHGILTKNNKSGNTDPGNGVSRSTTFSPTLARLLTTPERPPTISTSITTTAMRASCSSTSSSRTTSTAASTTTSAKNLTLPSAAPGVSISEILASSKNRNELTITPVVSQSAHVKEEASTSQDEDGDDCADRLVIDESEEQETREEDEMDAENIPQCQGCHMRSAQFVCAGCSNQWYCSRSCQVTAWDEHSEVCSG